MGVEICKVKLCCFYFFTINLIIWCENGCLPPAAFLPHCKLFRPHPYLSIVAIVMVVVTCWWCCLNMICHAAVLAAASCEAGGWPAPLDFQTPKGSGLTEDLLGKLWLVFKKKRHVLTRMHTFFFSEGTTVGLSILSSHPLIPSDTLCRWDHLCFV